MKAAEKLREEFARAPRFQRCPYVPGFGGHRRRWACKCTEADEFICGALHPDAHEAPAQVERRRQAATVVALREARVSTWLAELYGTGAPRFRVDPDDEPYKRPSEAKAEKTPPKRRTRRLSDAEWRRALIWIGRQRLRGELANRRAEVCSQTWLELRQPPAGSKPTSFLDEVRLAWLRAQMAIRAENETAWVLPNPKTQFHANGQKKAPKPE